MQLLPIFLLGSILVIVVVIALKPPIHIVHEPHRMHDQGTTLGKGRDYSFPLTATPITEEKDLYGGVAAHKKIAVVNHQTAKRGMGYAELGTSGPYPGTPIGVPVPAGALKDQVLVRAYETLVPNTRMGFDPPGGFESPFAGFEYNPSGFPSNPPLWNRGMGLYAPSKFGPGHNPYQGWPGLPAVGNVDSSVPLPPVDTQWLKTGVLTSNDGMVLLNLYQRPIAPAQDLWEYYAQDKNNFIVKLIGVTYLENGDTVREIIGKQGLGPWRVHLFMQNRYVWV